jgi:hypothetical protein
MAMTDPIMDQHARVWNAEAQLVRARYDREYVAMSIPDHMAVVRAAETELAEAKRKLIELVEAGNGK